MKKTRLNKKTFRDFIQARSYARSLKLESLGAWRTWSASGNRPFDIPSEPQNSYENKGWVDWSDWLGAKISTKNKIWQPFPAARAYVHTLNLINKDAWFDWIKSNERLADIPSNPQRVYKDKGWVDLYDWLGNEWLSLEEARSYVHSLNLKSQDEYIVWSKSVARPVNIPSDPLRVYGSQGWAGWADFVGNTEIKSYAKNLRSFEEARAYARSLRLSGRAEWEKLSKSGARPNDIPLIASQTYKNKGWLGWADFLGTNNVQGGQQIFRDFFDARAYVRLLKLSGYGEWKRWSKSGDKPDNIPSNPDKTYKSAGWSGWGDFLGSFVTWNKNSILSFVRSIEPLLSKLETKELHAIMVANGMVSASKHPTTYAHLLKSLRESGFSSDPDTIIQNVIEQLTQENNELKDEFLTPGTGFEQTGELLESDVLDELPVLRSLEDIKTIDILVGTGAVSDIETIEFLVCNKVSSIWQSVLTASSFFSIEDFKNEKGGHYFTEIQQRFFEQYQGANDLPVPVGYSFHKNGEFAAPNLMQRLTAYRVLTEKRVGNWSGVGAGKTISAVLTSRVINAHLTVIIAFNSTIEMWAQAILEVFPDSNVIIKERNAINFNENKPNYLLLNFESFQQSDSEKMVRQLVENYQVDFVVLDEVHNAKQRYKNIISLRRNVITNFLRSAESKNSKLCVLGMSATPVINNLYEAKALLELTTGKEFTDLETSNNVSNALAIHQQLLLNGLRYKPAYKQSVETVRPIISGDFYRSKLLAATKGSVLAVERILLEAKLPAILSAVRKGTMIYSQYVDGLIDPLRRAVEEAGYTVGIFTGQDKSGLQQFVQGKVDVLIGSKPVGTGVDGLQYVCSQMIVVCLPWTSAEYEQLVGRLHRQGAKFDKVTVTIPQVVLSQNDDVWSWDQMRLNRIEYKKTLADAAIDGIIPEGTLASEKTMLQNANEALQMWIARLEGTPNHISNIGSSIYV